jgi:hypothetical protein
MQIWWFDIDWLLWLFQNISPYYWSGLGIALCVGLSIIGAAWWVFWACMGQEGSGNSCLIELKRCTVTLKMWIKGDFPYDKAAEWCVLMCMSTFICAGVFSSRVAVCLELVSESLESHRKI